MKLCLTLLTALLFCAATSVSFAAKDKAAKGEAEKSARDAGKAGDKGDSAGKGDSADKGGTADKAAGTDKAKKHATAGDAPAEKAKPAAAVRGKIVKVAGDKLVISTGTKQNLKEVTLLKEGQQVAIIPAEGTPKRIDVPKPKAGAGKGAEAAKAGGNKPTEKGEKKADKASN